MQGKLLLKKVHCYYWYYYTYNEKCIVTTGTSILTMKSVLLLMVLLKLVRCSKELRVVKTIVLTSYFFSQETCVADAKT